MTPLPPHLAVRITIFRGRHDCSHLLIRYRCEVSR